MNIKKIKMMAWAKVLFPFNRSLTGKGVRQTISFIKNKINKNFTSKKIRSNTRVFDWKVPQEWSISNAYIEEIGGEKICDFKKNNLHVLGYSAPINKYLKKTEMLRLVHTLPKQPSAIPYVTSYYQKKIGFCMSHNNVEKIKKEYDSQDIFKVVIKSNFKKNGHLHYGELLLKGKSKQEILISTYLCHPSMANNELSGPIVSMSLIDYFKRKKNLAKSIRFLFIPETIGSIVYLKKNLDI